MADAAATPAPAEATGTAPPGEAPKAEEKPDDILEIVMEGVAEPVKIPKSKIPLEKLNPELGKFRADTDRKLSEVDRRTKELDARAEKYNTVEKLAAGVKAHPEMLIQLAKELGLDDDALAELSEKQIANRIKANLRDQEEAADPAKKAAREEREELEQLRKRDKEREQERRETLARGMQAQSENFIVQALGAGGWSKGSPLALEAAREMVPILRAAIEACKNDDLSDFALTHEDLAKGAKDALRKRASLLYDEDGEIEFTPKQLERAAAALAKKNGTGGPEKAKHPAETGTADRDASGRFKPKNGAEPIDSGSYLLRLLR